MATTTVDVVLGVVDRLTRPISAIQNRINRLTAPVQRVGRVLGNIGRAAGLDRLARSIGGVSTALGGVVNQAGAALGKLTALTGVAGLAAFKGTFGVANGIADIAKEIQNLSAVAGMSPEVFQKLAFGSLTVGVEADKLADIFKDVNDKLGDYAETGGGAMADFFENIAPKVGVTQKAFEGLSSADALQLYVRSLEEANVSQAEMTFYLEAIASDATLLLPLLRNGARGFHDLSREAERTGVVLDAEALELAKNYRGALTDLQGRFEGFRNAFGVGIMPAITEVVQAVTGWADANRDLINTKIEDWVGRVSQTFRDLMNPASGIRQTIDDLVDSAQNFVAYLWPVIDFVGGPLNAGLLALGAITFGPLIASLATLTGAIIMFGTALLTTPVGWFLGAVALIGAAVYLIYRNWDGIVDYFAGVWDRIKGAFDGGLASLATAILEFSPATHFMRGINALVEYLTGVNLYDVGAAIVWRLAEGFATLDETLAGWERKLFDFGVGLVTSMWDGMKVIWESFKADLVARVKDLVSWLPEWAQSSLGFDIQAVAPAPPALPSSFAGGVPVGGSVPNADLFFGEAPTAPTPPAINLPEIAAPPPANFMVDTPTLPAINLPEIVVPPPVVELPEIVAPAAPSLPAISLPEIVVPSFGQAPSVPASPSSISTSSVDASSVNVSNFQVPEPIIANQPQVVNAPFNVGGITVNAPGAMPAEIEGAVRRALRAQADQHRYAVLSSLED